MFPAVNTIGLLEVFKEVLKTGKNITHPLSFYQDGRIEGYRENIVYKIDDEHIMAVYSDITKEKTTEQQLKQTLAFLKSHQLALDESCIVTKSDIKGLITYVNDAFCQTTGYTKEEALGKTHSILRHPDNPKELYEDLWTTIKSKKVWKKIIKNKSKYGDYWVDLTILPLVNENDEIIEFIAVRHNITKMIEQQEELNKIVNTDLLTNLGNRYKLINDIESSIRPALAIIDIDNFSQINDLFGHKLGDKVIKQFASKLQEYKDDENLELYHIHSDEYVILHKDSSRDEFIEKIINIETQMRNVKAIVEEEEFSINFSTSISFESKDQLLQTADMALKIAKRGNKSLVIYSNEISLNEEYKNNIKWSKIIKVAIESDNIIPVYQAIVNNVTNEWEKYESLVRIQEEDKLISPFFFLDISKRTKQYTSITKTMIEKSFEKFKEIDKEVSINITIEDILNDEIKLFIYDSLEKYNIGHKIVFEIVESESIQVFETVITFIDKIKSYGCKIAIDDFGTGYSNFEYLVKLKADYIKIDGSLIKNIDKNKTSYLVVKNIVQFAKDLNMKTIAEFVENETVLNIVKELGIDYSQGYFFTEPNKELTIY